MIVVFNAQRIPENPVNTIVFPEHCDEQVAVDDDKFCDVYISIPANAIIYQRNTEGTYVCNYIHMIQTSMGIKHIGICIP